MKKNIYKKIFLLSIFVFVCLFALSILFIKQDNSQNAQAETSPDAIAIRVIKNEKFLSIDRWYKEQGFAGSPQKLKVDGYDAIRDGRTVYVGASNVTGACVGSNAVCNYDLDCGETGTCNLKNFYTNIYLISYNQSPEQATVDIFGQIISHWKFNANIISRGRCSQTDSILCLIDSECPVDEYCTSQKANIARDVRRLADLNNIKFALEDYKQKNSRYPKLQSGTYLPGSSLSVWPSWQETLAKELGLTLPSDPIDKMGNCSNSRFNPNTCWDDAKKEFDGTITPEEIKTPGGSKIYGYSTANGANYNICSNLETNYQNIQDYKCSAAVASNQSPIISSVNLVGNPKEEFKGYVEAYDPDGDNIFFGVDLINPDAGQWTSGVYKWQWDSGLNKFAIKNTIVNNQKLIHAAKTGNASSPGLYKIRITVKDSRGAQVTGDYEITVKGVGVVINSGDFSMIIGESKQFTLTGTDSSLNDLTNLSFTNAILPDGSTVTTIPSGFSLNGLNLDASYQATQKTGVYTINVYAEDATTHKRGNGYFKLTITNRPPKINSFKATYANGQGDNCSLPNNCEFAIDNSEDANIQVAASDPDPGHIVSYSLADNFGGKISIDSAGKITGLKNLNFESGSDQSFNISVKSEDNYCVNSQPSECSASAGFKLTVKKFCSVSRNMFTLPGAYTGTINLENGVPINDIMGRINFPIPDKCSQIGNGESKVTVGGVTQGLDIIFVVDTSGSMNGQENMDNCSSYCSLWGGYECCYDSTILPPNIPCITCPLNGSKPIDKTIDALKISVNSIRAKIDTLPPSITANVGLITYDNVVNNSETVALGSIRNDIQKNKLLNTITGLTASGGTNILDALNRAETMMAGSTSQNKIIILLSDGIPEIAKREASCHQYNTACSSKWCKCKNCDYCSDGGGGGGGGGSSYNTKADFKVALIDINETHCKNDSCADRTCEVTNPECNDVFCYTYTSYNCDLSDSTNYPLHTDYIKNQANIIKNLGNELYTIFFTTGTVDNSKKMCAWSSEASCPVAPGSEKYAYKADIANIDDIFRTIINRIFKKPKNITINGVNPGWVLDDTKISEVFDWSGINNFLSCNNNVPITATYSNNGSLVIGDIKYDYCPVLLHP